ncbi:MAG TPA: DciA family protein [Candidatus Omnitrophota bacterium]|nr:DciA family protein [Candidatus Omnitrophota bacterium]
MEDIKTTVQAVLNNLHKHGGAGPAPGPDDWLDRVLTKQERRYVAVAYFRNGVLGLKVDSSSRLYHLNLRRQELKDKLAAFCAEIKDIRLSVGATGSSRARAIKNSCKSAGL